MALRFKVQHPYKANLLWNININILGVIHQRCVVLLRDLYVWCLSSYRQDAVSLSKFPTEISWTSSKNEGNEDPFSIFPSNNVKSETCRSPLQHHPSGFPDRNTNRTKTSHHGNLYWYSPCLGHQFISFVMYEYIWWVGDYTHFEIMLYFIIWCSLNVEKFVVINA